MNYLSTLDLISLWFFFLSHTITACGACCFYSLIYDLWQHSASSRKRYANAQSALPHRTAPINYGGVRSLEMECSGTGQLKTLLFTLCRTRCSQSYNLEYNRTLLLLSDSVSQSLRARAGALSSSRRARGPRRLSSRAAGSDPDRRVLTRYKAHPAHHAARGCVHTLQSAETLPRHLSTSTQHSGVVHTFTQAETHHHCRAHSAYTTRRHGGCPYPTSNSLHPPSVRAAPPAASTDVRQTSTAPPTSPPLTLPPPRRRAFQTGVFGPIRLRRA